MLSSAISATRRDTLSPAPIYSLVSKRQAAETRKATSTAGMSAKYQYSVAMTCGACSAAVNRVLTKMEGAHLQ